MSKNILWVDDNHYRYQLFREIDETVVRIHWCEDLFILAGYLEFNDESIKYDAVIFDIMLPSYHFSPSDSRLKFYDDSSGWTGYRFLIDNYKFLNDYFNGMIAVSSGYPEEMIYDRLVLDGFNPNVFKIFHKSRLGVIERVIEWVQNSPPSMITDSNNGLPVRSNIDLYSFDVIWIDDEHLPPRITEELYKRGYDAHYNECIRHDFIKLVSFEDFYNAFFNLNLHKVDMTKDLNGLVNIENGYDFGEYIADCVLHEPEIKKG